MKADRRIPWEFAGPLAVGVLLLLLLWWARSQSPASTAGEGYPAMEEIALEVRKKQMWKLRLIRERALQRQVLEVAESDWVKGSLRQGKKTWPVKLRLKGDWTDHLEGGKWSLRVKIDDSTAFKRLRVFSLQNPVTRNFLDEWYFHKVLRQEGVLTPYYDFVRLRFNSAELGIYAIEQHFTKELLESQGRREGPIVKFNEDGMWEARRVALERPELPYTDMPHYEAAHPEVFLYRRFLFPGATGPTEGFQADRRAQHRHALSLLHDAKYDLHPARTSMHLRRFAQQYALTDLFRAHHSLVWHNRRYYYDPIASRLEPIVFDAYAGPRGGNYLNGPFIGYRCNGQTHYNGREDRMGIALFRETAFVRWYYEYLHAYTSVAFLDSLEAVHGADLSQRERYLRHEFLFYNYDRNTLARHAEEIRDALVLDMGKITVLEERMGFCVVNENPVPVEVEVENEGGDVRREFLEANDGRGPADQIFVRREGLLGVRIWVPGASEKQNLLLPQ